MCVLSDLSRTHFWTLLGRLGALWGRSWALLGRSWAFLGALGIGRLLGLLGCLGSPLGALGRLLNALWSLLGRSLALSGLMGALGARLGSKEATQLH